jgi:hypothetical protein
VCWRATNTFTLAALVVAALTGEPAVHAGEALSAAQTDPPVSNIIPLGWSGAATGWWR